MNPILLFSLKRFYDIDISETALASEQLINQLNTHSESIQNYNEFSDEEGWQLINRIAWGNFNYKKSLLGQDFDLIKNNPSSSILSLLEGVHFDFQEQLQLNQILPTDSSQRKALINALNSNYVIQGPPGTGKSHSIVNLISSYVAADKKVLFVSQKKSALDVVYNNLKAADLRELTAYFNAQKDEKKTFFKELKMSWEILQKNASVKADLKENSVELLNYFENKLTIQNELVLELLRSGLKKENLVYEGAIPELASWRNHFESLLKLDAKINQVSAGKFSLHEITVFDKAIYSEPKPLIVLEKRISDLLQALSTIQKYSELNRKELTQKCLAASELGMENKTQQDLINDKSKRFK